MLGVSSTELRQIQLKLQNWKKCVMHISISSLCSFLSSINVTTWTVGYAIPYHADLLFKQYKVGYGIVSLQAKEAKHSGVKDDLTLTNRSTVSTPIGKWWQVMRSNYVRLLLFARTSAHAFILYLTLPVTLSIPL